jgi:hypothetical protein
MKDELDLSFMNNPVPQEEAVARTTNWRVLYQEVMECEEKDILRAFYIPIEDIINLYKFFKHHKCEVKGVRGYFGHNPLDPIDPTIYETEFLLCPVDKDGCDILTAPPSLGLADGTSTIYDFTTPCPTNCDTSSVLYSNTNALRKK